MKAIVALSISTFALLALTFVNCGISSYERTRMPEKQWAEYKLQHNKSYSDEEDKMRFEIFQNTLKTIEEHNVKYEKGESTYKMGLNHMSDWTVEEKSKMFGGVLNRPPPQANTESDE